MTKLIRVDQCHWSNGDKLKEAYINPVQIVFLNRAVKRDPKILPNPDGTYSGPDLAETDIMCQGYSLRVIQTMEEINRLIDDANH